MYAGAAGAGTETAHGKQRDQGHSGSFIEANEGESAAGGCGVPKLPGLKPPIIYAGFLRYTKGYIPYF